ncbi:MAG: hypothetical protein FD169_1074 [Bacillota bacterium]|nr:MAG: hypothetical protein FD169_1074 [Bacillota bacterium]
MVYFLTFFHLIVGVALLLAFQRKTTRLYLHLGLGSLGIGAGMLAILVWLVLANR